MPVKPVTGKVLMERADAAIPGVQMKAQRRLGLALWWPRITSAFVIAGGAQKLRVAVAVGCVLVGASAGCSSPLAGEHTEHTGKHVSRRVAASNFGHPRRVDSWHWSYAGQLGRLAHAKRGEQQRFRLRR